MSDSNNREGNVTGICACCESPRLAELNADLESGLGLTPMARKYNVSRSSVQRHRAHCLPIQAVLKDRRAKRALLAVVTPPAPRAPDPFGGVLPEVGPVASEAPASGVATPVAPPANTREILADLHAMNMGLAEVYRDVLALRGIPPVQISGLIQRGYELEIKTSLALESRDGGLGTEGGARYVFCERGDAVILGRCVDAVNGAESLEEARTAVETIRAELTKQIDPRMVPDRGYVDVSPDDWDEAARPRGPAELAAELALGDRSSAAWLAPPAPSPAMDDPGGVATPPTPAEPQGDPVACEQAAPEPEVPAPAEPEHGLVVHRLPEPSEAEIRADRDRRFEGAFGRPAAPRAVPRQEQGRLVVMPPPDNGTVVMPEEMPPSWWDDHRGWDPL